MTAKYVSQATRTTDLTLFYKPDLRLLLNRSQTTIDKWLAKGVLPAPHRLAGRCCWTRKQLMQWANDQGIGHIFDPA